MGVSSINEMGIIRLKSKAYMVSVGLGLLSMLGALISLVFHIDILTNLSASGTGVSMEIMGYYLIFESRKNPVVRDEFVNAIFGLGCLIFGVLLLIRVWIF